MVKLRKWQLMHSNTPIAVLEVYEADQPWFHCHFSSLSKYEEHRSFFNDFQIKYSDGSISDYDKFFGTLKEHDYTLQDGNLEMVRFIILLDIAKGEARLRGEIIENT